MKFIDAKKIIEESSTFIEFKKNHKKASVCAGFFIIDYFSNDSKNSIDYIVDEDIYTFEIKDDMNVKMNKDKILEVETDQPKLVAINEDKLNIKIDTNELKSIAGTRALDEGIASKITKIIAILQSHHDNIIWNLTCMLEGLIILHLLVDANTGKIIKFERKSMMDFVKKKK